MRQMRPEGGDHMETCELILDFGKTKKAVTFTPPALLSRLLAESGAPVEMPCGGKGRCLKCKVRVSGAVSPMGEREASLLTPEEKAAGVRFACMTEAVGAAAVSLSKAAHKEEILTEGELPAFARRPWGRKLGIAIDIGTTTLAAYLYRLEDGVRLAEGSDKNPQGVFGADVISRMEKALAGEGEALARAIRGGLANLIAALCRQAGQPIAEVDSLVLTGNTAMLYLLTGRNPRSITAAPFEPDCAFGEWLEPAQLDLPLSPDCRVYLPRILSAYVGADITTALLASGLYRDGQVAEGAPRVLVDIGTNGEMALAAKGRFLCCSTAAGPAFEGAGIHQGMLAKTGAISAVTFEGGRFGYTVLGGGEAVGLCGSGLLDAVAALCDAGILDETGVILEEGHAFEGCITEVGEQPAFRLPDTGVVLTQQDIRAVQLAKSAICGGLLTLLDEAGLQPDEVEELLIAGGFGSRIRVASAERIGLIPPGFAAKARAIGNAAGAGASMVLLSEEIRRQSEGMIGQAKTVELSADPRFMEHYVDGMYFDC